MSKISVIIPAYNSSALIKRTMDSVLAQEGDFEIIIVDDCSTDDTVAIVEGLNKSGIKVFRQNRNMGPAAARNRGLAAASGEYCAFLDGDDFWEPDFLKETVAFLDGHPEAVAVSVMQCHKILGKEPSIVPKGTNVSEAIILEDFFDFWRKYNHVCTGSVLFRTEIALKIGGQREDLRICEDLEYWAMLALHGKWGFIPKVLFTSDGGAVTRKQGWLEKNMIRWNNAPPFEEWRKRIDAQQSQWKTVSMETALGRIVRNLCYCHIMSRKDILARREVRDFGRLFPKNKINGIFRYMALTAASWKIWCAFLRYREIHRAV